MKINIYLLGIIVIIIDGLLLNFLPSYFNNLNYLYPMLSITYLVAIYSYSNDYLKKSFILGCIYDLLYSHIIFYNAFLFLFLAKINKKIFNYIQVNLINKIIILIINIILYDTINFLIIYFSKYNLVTINDLFYKIINSLFLNILSLFIFTFLLKKINFKHKLK